jgi:tetratricopeptide (TPR) repeat protein
MERPLQIEPHIEDVWSRTSSKYRGRAVVLLLLNMMLFGVLCCFMFWLRTGWHFPPTYEHYADVFLGAVRIAGEGQVTPYDLVTRPISLRLVPMQGVVIGLLIASLASIPILVTILYRLPAALPFCAMVGLFAVMPWLSANLVLACVITHFVRKRLKFRFATALIAFIPIGIYLLMATRHYAAPLDLLTTPFEQGLVVVPLLLSVVASCALVASVLAIAHVVNYRPGAITPLLAVMFLAPCVLFVTKVGRDELHYRFLEERYGPKSNEYFAPTDAQRYIRQVARRLWMESPEPRPTIDELEANVISFWDSQFMALDEVAPIGHAIDHQLLKRLGEFAAQQHRVEVDCDKFIASFHDSAYVPSVLYIKGRAQNMRIRRRTFREQGLLRYYDGYASERSRETWEVLMGNYPDSPLSDVARYQLAKLESRSGRVDEAIRLLTDVGKTTREAAQRTPVAVGTLGKKPPTASLEAEFATIVRDANELRQLLVNNRDPRTGDAPLVAYLRCDARHEAYHQNLQEILERYSGLPHLMIRDNIEVELAMQCTTSAERIQYLEGILARFSDSDTTPRVLYELGRAYEENGHLTEARKAFETVFQDYPRTRFAADARRRRGH